MKIEHNNVKVRVILCLLTIDDSKEKKMAVSDNWSEMEESLAWRDVFEKR